MTEAWIALAGTLFGGLGLEIGRRWLYRSKNKEDTATALRTELRLELSTMRMEMEKLKKEAALSDDYSDRWRDKYYSLVAGIARGDVESVKKIIDE